MVIVCCMVFYSLFRFKARPNQPEPSQTGGHKTVEVIWTVVPFLIVIWIFLLTARGMSRSDPGPKDQPADIEVTGARWWWQGRYRDGGFYVAHELHIPVGKRLLVSLDSPDVIHSFWVPELSRKMDAIPGHPNAIWLQADRPGTYQGFCGEYCGAQHAWMHFIVVAQPPEEYARWQHAQATPAQVSATPAPGQVLFQRMTCVNCHAVSGVSVTGRSAPDLTHFASRKKLGSGIADNTSANLARWLKNPQNVKPGALMPNPELTDKQIADLTEWLESLR